MPVKREPAVKAGTKEDEISWVSKVTNLIAYSPSLASSVFSTGNPPDQPKIPNKDAPWTLEAKTSLGSGSSCLAGPVPTVFHSSNENFIIYPEIEAL